VKVQGGASGRVGSDFLVAVGGNWSSWSDLDASLVAQGGAQDSWSAHAGVEWDGIRFRNRSLPLRVGGRTGTLPFRWDATTAREFGTEHAVTFGAGLVLANGAVNPDLSLDIGQRGGTSSGLDESFWRFGFSVKVLGR
jgi:hypothetical protein